MVHMMWNVNFIREFTPPTHQHASHDTWLFASAQHLVHASTAGNKHGGVVVASPAAAADLPSPPLLSSLLDSILARAARIESTQETSAFCSIGHFNWQILDSSFTSVAEEESGEIIVVEVAVVRWSSASDAAGVRIVEKGHIGAGKIQVVSQRRASTTHLSIYHTSSIELWTFNH